MNQKNEKYNKQRDTRGKCDVPVCPKPMGICKINSQGMCCYYCPNKSRCSLGACHKLPSKCGFNNKREV